MYSLCSPTGLMIAILIPIAILCAIVFIWQYSCWHRGNTISDKQVVWLLLSLLIIATISIGMFLLISFGKLGNGQFVCF